ncbi:MAG: hypothetical protein HKN83_12340 [Gammaproteobacteria bacterium]|nr:hypothetical protein [Gammaproteobacteria bacterium]
MDEYIYFHRSLIIDELNQIVTLSIQAHRLGEMRVGGCIDSRAIVALMAQQTFLVYISTANSEILVTSIVVVFFFAI